MSNRISPAESFCIEGVFHHSRVFVLRECLTRMNPSVKKQLFYVDGFLESSQTMFVTRKNIFSFFTIKMRKIKAFLLSLFNFFNGVHFLIILCLPDFYTDYPTAQEVQCWNFLVIF
jgi:hypothetical protein